MRGKTQRRVPPALAATFFALAALHLAGCPSTPRESASSRTSILLVTIDSLRADRVGYAGYAQGATPNLDTLASHSVRFTQAQTPVPLTTPALASLLTGRYPSHHGLRVDERGSLAASETTLAEALKDAGYSTGAIGGSLLVHPRHGLDQGFAQYLEAFGEIPRPREAPIQGFPATRVVDRALEWLEGNYRQDFFLWVNFHDPHFFYSPPAPYITRFADRPYDGEVAYVDTELGRLLNRLREYGAAERTLVIVAGNHGEGLMDHGEAYHGTLLHQTTLRVPLLIRPAGPEPAGRDVSVPVSLVDVMPTILEAAGVSAPEEMDGRSLARALAAGGDPDVDAERPLLAETIQPRALFGWVPLAGVRAGRWSYVAGPAPRLYDLQADPGEERNVIAEHGDVAARLAGEAARIRFDQPPCGGCAALAAELKLAWPPVGRPGPPVDPHDRIDVANDALKAHRTMKRGMVEPAMLLLREVLARDPDNHQALVDLGWLSGLGKKQAELRPSHDMLMKAQAMYGDDGEIYHLLAHMDEVGPSPDPARSTKLYELATKLDPLNEEALYDAACAEARAGRPEDAFVLLERAIAAGWRDYPHMRKDTDLDTLRSDARFAKLVPPAPERPGGKAKGKGGTATAAPASNSPS